MSFLNTLLHYLSGPQYSTSLLWALDGNGHYCIPSYHKYKPALYIAYLNIIQLRKLTATKIDNKLQQGTHESQELTLSCISKSLVNLHFWQDLHQTAQKINTV